MSDHHQLNRRTDGLTSCPHSPPQIKGQICMQVVQQSMATFNSSEIQVYSAHSHRRVEAGEEGGLQTSATHFLTFLTSPLKDCYLKKWHTKINALG